MRRMLKALAVVVGVLLLALAIAAVLVVWWYRSVVPPRPTPTPRPEASLPWSDDFSDTASGWQVGSDTTAEVGYYEGALRILVKSPKLLAWAFAGHEFSDFHLTVDATQVAGPNDNEYGVLVRIQDRNHLYRFSISGDGYYQVSKHTGDEWERMTAEWPQSDAIHTGAAANRLEVICQGETMAFLVNGVQLAQVQDADYLQGDIGLYAGTFYEPGVEIHFDNLSIVEP
jgi:hypothetical protein